MRPVTVEQSIPGTTMDRKIKRKHWTLGRIIGLAAGVVFVAFAVYVYLVRFQTLSLNVNREQLTISVVNRGAFQEFIPVVGNVLPINTYFLDAVEGGRVAEVYLQGGAMVRKGDRILKLENTTLLLDIMRREAEFFQQSDNLRSTRLSLEQSRLSQDKELADVENQLQQQGRISQRYEKLAKENLVSQQEYELAKDQYEYLQKRRVLILESRSNDTQMRQAQIKALEDSLKRMEENLKVARNKLDELTVKAPVSGQLTALDAEIGQSKNPGQRLGQIDVLNEFKVRAEIDEHYINRINQGQVGQVEVAEKNYHLAVKKIYPEVKGGKFEVDLNFVDQAPSGIRRGQTLHIRLELSEVETAVLLPRGGFFQKTGGNWVYVLDQPGSMAVKRNIRLGRQNPEFFEVLEGLIPGERVITSAYENFGDIDRLLLK